MLAYLSCLALNVLCSEIHPEWPDSPVLKELYAEIAGTDLKEPTEAMLLASFLKRSSTIDQKFDFANINGRIQRIVGTLSKPLSSAACCKQECAIGKYNSCVKSCYFCIRDPSDPKKQMCDSHSMTSQVGRRGNRQVQGHPKERHTLSCDRAVLPLHRSTASGVYHRLRPPSGCFWRQCF